MTKEELLRAARGKPSPFEFGGVTYLLLPLPWGEFKELQGAYKGADADAAELLTFEVVARAVCDESGARLLDAADVAHLPLSAINAVFHEVARRSGIPVPGERGND